MEVITSPTCTHTKTRIVPRCGALSQVKLILSPKQRAKPAASRTRKSCTNAAVCGALSFFTKAGELYGAKFGPKMTAVRDPGVAGR